MSFEKQQQVSSSLTQNMKQINDLINKQAFEREVVSQDSGLYLGFHCTENM